MLYKSKEDYLKGTSITPFMVKTIFFENLFNNMLRHTSLIACPASRGRRVSQIATAIFLPRPDAKALGDSVQPCLACILLNFYSFRGNRGALIQKSSG